MAVNFYLDKRTDRKGDAPVRVSIIIRGVRCLTSTGIKAMPTKWDALRQQARKGTTVNAAGMSWATVNAALARISGHFASFESECLTRGYVPTAKDLKEELAKAMGREEIKGTEVNKTPGFWEYYAMFIAERSAANQWTVTTHQRFATLKGHMVAWKARGLTFATFTEAGFGSFITFLRERRGLKNSTIGKQVSYLKWFLRWAYIRGYNTNPAFQTFSPKLKTAQTQVVFLEWDELMKLLDYEVPATGTVVTLHDARGEEYTKEVHAAEGLRAARDIFCFCCFTSLRYSDAANLRRANVGVSSITITTVKTADTITIELNKYARAILERYADEDFGDYALPRLANQRMNMYLKEVCELCEINRPVTRTYYRGTERIDETRPKFQWIGTHTGRRTFICNALSMGIPAEIVMKWTGHADYKSMKPYVDIVNSAKAEAMSLFDKR